jgi:hypothetical protein
MCRLVYLIGLVLFTAGLSSAVWAGGSQLTYQETTEQTVDSTEVIIVPTATGRDLTISFPNSRYRFTTDAAFNTRQCTVSQNDETPTTLFRRRGNMVVIRKGDQGCVASIDELPWYQTPFGLVDFILSDTRKIKFYMATVSEHADKDDDPGAMLKMVATKDDTETLTMAGQSVETYRVTITLSGLKSLFWKITYWYRCSDGLVVKYTDTRGGPGTPTTYGLLVKEEVLP